MPHTETIYLLLDAAALIAVAIMMIQTEALMTLTPQEKRIHDMLEKLALDEYDLRTWAAVDILAKLRWFGDLRDDETDDMVMPCVISWKMKAEPLT